MREPPSLFAYREAQKKLKEFEQRKKALLDIAMFSLSSQVEKKERETFQGEIVDALENAYYSLEMHYKSIIEDFEREEDES